MLLQSPQNYRLLIDKNIFRQNSSFQNVRFKPEVDKIKPEVPSQMEWKKILINSFIKNRAMKIEIYNTSINVFALKQVIDLSCHHVVTKKRF